MNYTTPNESHHSNKSSYEGAIVRVPCGTYTTGSKETNTTVGDGREYVFYKTFIYLHGKLYPL